jgi:hypothetical protein
MPKSNDHPQGIENLLRFVENARMSAESTVGTSLGRPRRLLSIADRAARLQALAFCTSKVAKILEKYSEWFDDETLPIKERMNAGDRLLAYALGKPVQPVDQDLTQTTKKIVELRWLPPDPNDHSRVIEPEP